MQDRRALVAARVVFVAYTILLLLGTLWPNLQIDVGDVPRPDLYMHLLAFGGFTALMLVCQWFGPLLSARNIAWAGVVSTGFALANESAQALPFIHRHARLDDAAANILGVALPLMGALLLGAISNGGDAHD
ncbi:MAG: hypothetical protein EA380_11120 [Phycisphaeraceae bacterium]|nr:MAG: hypothetical protein EA380_11120 [Phycisphaeraceae bacterium]